jgi:hypothetical protein
MIGLEQMRKLNSNSRLELAAFGLVPVPAIPLFTEGASRQQMSVDASAQDRMSRNE